MKIKKYMVISLLEVFKEKGCNTIDDAIDLLNTEVKNDIDNVMVIKKILEGKEIEKEGK